MKKGDALAYAISYGALKDPSTVISEFHGHTEQRAEKGITVKLELAGFYDVIPDQF